MKIRTRFAPSPTGYLHVGGARTALYSWLFARQSGGEFVLRIEDTDIQRSSEASAIQILDGLSFLGLTADEGPFYQSERFDLYHDYCRRLLDADKAYEKDGAIYFRAKTTEAVVVDDLILGSVRFPAKEMTDFVIRKQDGSPTYHLAVVVDDALMSITHVIRGMDHLANTPKHILLFRALGFEVPVFAHLPMILGTDKQPLSKRHGASGVDEYKKMGVLPIAMRNFLARLGWGHENQEVFDDEDLLAKFDLKRVSKNPAVFDLQKLYWINGQHIKSTPLGEIVQAISEVTGRPYAGYEAHVDLVRPKCQTLLEVADHVDRILNDPDEFDPKGVAKFIKPHTRSALAIWVKKIDENTVFDPMRLEYQLRDVADKLDFKPAELIHPTRLALTGGTVGPGLFDLMMAVGKEACIRRLNTFLARQESLGV